MVKVDTKPVKPVIDDRQVLNHQISRFAAKGWQIISRDETAVQLRKPKEWSVPMLGIGTAGLVFGFGIIFLLLAVVDYALKNDRTLYFTAEQARHGDIPIPVTRFNWPLFAVGVGLSFALLACVFLSI